MELLSDAAFKLYLYLCLHTDRHTGQMVCELSELACVLQRESEAVMASLEELRVCEVCALAGDSSAWTVEIRDRFWPYERLLTSDPSLDRIHYVRQIRRLLLDRACVRSCFSAADQKLAATLYHRGAPLAHVERAIWLGCARKYIALLKAAEQAPMFVTSLHYFATIVDEVAAASVGDDYWSHVRRKAEQLERRWIESRRRNVPASSREDKTRETK
jgi:hypothetical protein